MSNESDGNTTETDYELALRLAGMAPSKPKPIESAPIVREAIEVPVVEAPTEKMLDVRVKTLNNPNSILKKWRDSECPRTLLDEVFTESNKAVVENRIVANHSEPDHFFEKPNVKSFNKVFNELDEELLLETDEHVNLDSLDKELMAVEFKPKKRRSLK